MDAARSSSGRPVGHGEDQALTNIVLREGYDTVYQRTAAIHTLAPTTYRQLSRMYLRWDRSYIVEGFSLREVHVHAVPEEEPGAADRHVRRLEPAARPLLLGLC